LGVTTPKKIGGQKRQNFGAISDNVASWSQISPDLNKMSSTGKQLQTVIAPVHFHQIWWTLLLWSTNG